MLLGDVSVGGVPDPAGLWVLGLGSRRCCWPAQHLTRKNSRHPLLVVGLAALGILFLAYQWLSRAVSEQAWARAQAIAIVDNVPAQVQPAPLAGVGVYLWPRRRPGARAGLTVVVKRASRPTCRPTTTTLLLPLSADEHHNRP